MHGNSAQLVRLKNLSAHNNKSENKINRPANQEGFSGSERLYSKQNQVSFTGNPRLVQNIATKIVTNSKDKLPLKLCTGKISSNTSCIPSSKNF